MKEKCKNAVQAGSNVLLGDLFLTGIRAYREKQLENSGLQPIFPVWGMPTRKRANSMIRSGLRAKLTCVDPKLLAPEFVGREFDEELLSALPPEIHPCGENGNTTRLRMRGRGSSTTCRLKWVRSYPATDLCLPT